MIEPTYFLACKIFEDAGFQDRLHGVLEDEEGLDVDFLRTALARTEREWQALEERDVDTQHLLTQTYKHIIYCVPTFSNPSSKTMSLKRRTELLALAREFDALVITDDCYDFLRWPEDSAIPQDKLGACPPRIVDLDRSTEGCNEYGNAVSNG